MTATRGLMWLPLAVLAAAFGCATILGVEDIVATDGGTPLLTEDGSVIVVPPGPPECDTDDQCSGKLALVPILDSGVVFVRPDAGAADAGDAGAAEAGPPTPRRCATVRCLSKRCVLFARDDDGDMLSVACNSSDPQYPVQKSANIDCDDTQSGVVTNSQVDCTDGTFKLPGVGECRPGKARCKPDGTFDTCIGAISVKTEACDNQKDDNCNGTIDEGCPCGTGAVRNCGPGIDAGICRDGTQACVNAKWDNCDAVFPTGKMCNGKDNDCNGRIDDVEPFCTRDPGGGRK